MRPYLTHTSGAKTANGTAGAAIEMVDTLLDGREIVVAGQVAVAGEVSFGGESVHGVLGLPVVVGPDGWSRILLDDLAVDEERRLAAVSRQISSALAAWTSAGVGDGGR